MADDFLPQNPDELADWLDDFIAVATANLAACGFVAGDLTELAALAVQLRTNNTNQANQEKLFHAAVLQVGTTQGLADPLARKLMKHAQEAFGMTPALVEQLGGTVRKTTRTRHGAPTEVPGMVIERKGTQIIIHFGTDPNNEQINGKPTGAKGCNVERKKAGETEWTLIAFDTSSPYVDTVTGPAINISYRVAYRGTKETDIGPTSPEQTVAAGG